MKREVDETPMFVRFSGQRWSVGCLDVVLVGIDHYAISFWMNTRPSLRGAMRQL